MFFVISQFADSFICSTFKGFTLVQLANLNVVVFKPVWHQYL